VLRQLAGWARETKSAAGFRVTSDVAIRRVKEWKRVQCASVVSVHGAFSTRAFGDSSLIFVQEYFPLAKSLLETYFPTTQPGLQGNRQRPAPTTEPTLWSYVAQIANALKVIHAESLAARCLDLTKILVTDKNRVRLNGCGILDVVRTEDTRSLAELQVEDLHLFGKVMLSLATHTHPSHLQAPGQYQAAADKLGRTCSTELRDALYWLLNPPQPGSTKTIDEFIRGTAMHFAKGFNDSLNANDQLTSELTTAVENGRIARLMMRLSAINERPDLNGDTKWAETGDRYTLKLFRDYVFHQVDANGKPVLDIGHMITCLNKLDAGVDEQIILTTRDNESIFVVTYKKMKELLRNSFGELMRASKGRGGGL
jgi:PAB-dependent poly(A)-specific ribonuclease subunit 3